MIWLDIVRLDATSDFTQMQKQAVRVRLDYMVKSKNKLVWRYLEQNQAKRSSCLEFEKACQSELTLFFICNAVKLLALKQSLLLSAIYINVAWLDWSSEFLSCSLICFHSCCFHFCYWEESMHQISTYSSKRHSQKSGWRRDVCWQYIAAKVFQSTKTWVENWTESTSGHLQTLQ